MVDPQLEQLGTTHTYVARAWYRDTATWFNIISFLVIVLQETTFQEAIPARFHPAVIAAVTVLNLLIRFHSSTRPVALTEGTPVQVNSIAPKAAATVDKGAVSDKTRTLLPLVLIPLLFTANCAGRMSPLQQIQVSHDALATAQDLEVQLCLGVANVTVAAALPTVNHCTTAVATTIGLTDARHQAISRQFVTALTIHKALTAQGAAGATSMDTATLKATITTILNLIAELQPTPDVVRLANTVKAGQVK